jgi:hypothetical protein
MVPMTLEGASRRAPDQQRGLLLHGLVKRPPSLARCSMENSYGRNQISD